MAITNARMQMRRGLEADFDPDKMQPGEWAVSLDKKYVRMCFSPGVCVRMATYDAFEVDMAQIEEILSTCETIEEAVAKINTEVSANAQAVEEYTEQAKQYRDEAKQFRDEAEQFAPEGYVKLQETVASNTAKIDTIIEKAELNIKNSTSGDNLHLTDSANSKVVEFGLYGKATQDGEPTPDNPIEIVVSGSDGSVEVVSCGKNLLKNTATTQTVNGITFTVNEDGSVTASGTATAYTGFLLRSGLIEQNVIFSGSPTGALHHSTYAMEAYNITQQIRIGFVNANETLEIPAQGNDTINLLIGVWSGATLDNVTFYPMIRLASDTDDTYEPYKETTATIPTTDFAGIKVSSGGNYTDENGQQWIRDEVVKYADGSGKRIQRIGKYVFNGTESWYKNGESETEYRYYLNKTRIGIDTVNNNGMCTHFQIANTTSQTTILIYSPSVPTSLYIGAQDILTTENTVESFKEWLSNNNVSILYILATPIIIDLTAEEIAEIEKLHTFYPITNISNDSDCGMSIKYLCDSKNYIDNRLAQIEAVLINNI